MGRMLMVHEWGGWADSKFSGKTREEKGPVLTGASYELPADDRYLATKKEVASAAGSPPTTVDAVTS